MRIVSWNCNEGFWKKCDHISDFEADIYVICECENPAKSTSEKYKEFATNYLWIGENKNKGLGVFAKENIQLEYIKLNNEFVEDYLCVGKDNKVEMGKLAKENKKVEEIKDHIKFTYFLPVRVKDELNHTFNLLAVWAMPEYVEMIHDFYNANKDLFNENLVMCGDLNSSILFDDRGEHKGKNFGMLIRYLKRRHNLIPVYHTLNNKEKHGYESEATHFYKKQLNKRFHIDHVFSAPYITYKLDIIDNVKWIKLSDHLPLVFEIYETKFD